MARRRNLEGILVGVIVVVVIFWTYVVQPVLIWIQENLIISILIGVLILFALGYGIKLWLDHKGLSIHRDVEDVKNLLK